MVAAGKIYIKMDMKRLFVGLSSQCIACIRHLNYDNIISLVWQVVGIIAFQGCSYHFIFYHFRQQFQFHIDQALSSTQPIHDHSLVTFARNSRRFVYPAHSRFHEIHCIDNVLLLQQQILQQSTTLFDKPSYRYHVFIHALTKKYII